MNLLMSLVRLRKISTNPTSAATFSSGLLFFLLLYHGKTAYGTKCIIRNNHLRLFAAPPLHPVCGLWGLTPVQKWIKNGTQSQSKARGKVTHGRIVQKHVTFNLENHQGNHGGQQLESGTPFRKQFRKKRQGNHYQYEHRVNLQYKMRIQIGRPAVRIVRTKPFKKTRTCTTCEM